MRTFNNKQKPNQVVDLSKNTKFEAAEKLRLEGGGDDEAARLAAEEEARIAAEEAAKGAGGGDDEAIRLAQEEKARLAEEAAEKEKATGKTDDLNKVEFGSPEYFSYLSEKLDRKIESHDDLAQTKNPLEGDEHLTKLYNWREKTGLPLEDYFKYNEDYDGMEAIKVARKFLQTEYPTLNKTQIELELTRRFLPSEDDIDENASAFKTIELEKYSTKGREHFNKLRVKLDSPDKGRYPKEIQEKLKFADETIANYKSTKENTSKHDEYIQKFSNATESIKLGLSEDLSINFIVDEASRKSLPETMKTMPRWVNKDGSPNHKVMVEDGIKLQYFDKILELVYQQGVSGGADGTVKAMKNSTLGKQDNKGSQQDNEGKKTSGIQDKERLIKSQSRRMSFGRRRNK